ncbi:MAG: ABC transporter ATP-binding protein [Bryobacterales bacterium]|nr:energy-coupling factor ABC transporter ATP-binding protein [Bryobacteraceae bacterium]MDW8131048.1 ABC transporter ATP-binding protein [Bryobacterales bacterium]
MTSVLEVENLRFSFDGRTEVIRGVSFEVRPADSLAILGASGAGKSTLLWCVLGLLPARGTVRILGAPRTRASLRHVGVVFQNPEDQLFMPRLLDDVALPLINRGVEVEQARTRALSLLERLGLAGACHRPASQLSLGERKKAAIAAALIASPQLLLLDEPTAELDRRSARSLTQELLALPMSLVLATHDLELARTVCRRALVLRSGAVMAEGTVCRILDDPALLERAELI